MIETQIYKTHHFRENKETRAIPVVLDIEERTAKRASPETLETKDYAVFGDWMVLLATRGQKESLDSMEILDLRDFRARKVVRVTRARLDPRVHKDITVSCVRLNLL